MSRNFVKPETVLKRSEELLALGTPQSEQQALDSLMEVFQSKRFKQTPLATLEPIMERFLSLCTSLKKPRLARDALGLYRIAAQSVSVTSVEKIINKFIAGSEEKLAKAQQEAKAILGDESTTEVKKADVEDDLELPLQPETLLMDSLLGDDAVADDKDRVERSVVNPWLRFCWEAYKSCLDVCKSNNRLESVYQNIALQAFNFCKSHNRRSEFRRLCEQIRKELQNAQKYSNQTFAINFADVDTLTRHLDLRFVQLDIAIDLELWQEAFRSVEDIHGLLVYPGAKRATKASMMANYYNKLTKIFVAEGGSGTMAVFRAAAWSRYLTYGEANEKTAAATLLSALAVPLHEGEAGEVRNGQRLVALLNLSKMPTRKGLLAEIIAKDTLRKVPAEIRDLYKLLEVDFHPLLTVKQIAPIVAALAEQEDYAGYVRSLQPVVLSRLFKALSDVYSTVSISQILALLKPFESGPWKFDEQQLEKFVMVASKRKELIVSVDHVSKSITFQEDASANVTPLVEYTNLNASSRPQTQLNRLAIALQNTIAYLDPSIAERAREAREQAIANATAVMEDERKANQHRQAIVQRRRQKLDEINTRREREEASVREERARIAAREAAEREAELTKQRERERVQREIENIKAQEARKLAETLNARGGLKIDMSKMGENIDTETLLAMQSQQIEKEQKTIAERTRIIAKRVDHIERALRKEEIPLIEADYEKQKSADREAHQKQIEAERQAALEKHQHDLELKKRLGRMLADYQVVRNMVESKRADEFAAKRAAAEKKIAEEKAKLKKKVLAERAAKRKQEQEERKRIEEEEKREAERLAAEEREAAEQEAKVQAEREEKERRRAEREAERAADNEKGQAQRRREEEAEARRRAERSAPPAFSRPSPVPASAAPTGERKRLALQPRTVATPPTASAVGVSAPTEGAPSAADTIAHAAASGKFMAPAARAAAGGASSWRERAAQAAGGASSPSPAPSSPAIAPATPAAAPESKPQMNRAPASGGGSSWRDREAAAGTGDRPKPAWAKRS
ncbi:hypothetical protein QFC21_001023 [Naganishia friedmannii]|uniref:Uncharacterized protein n=1 Tax=Naganishia friedmannii TaxID=89922 RepID=A0ACC2W8N7_9TREE|nr:hypothetical protein QFC21_001023 [Naganishia friedmannii]